MKTFSLYNPCFLCPRNCGINRECSFIQEQKRKFGYCGESSALRLACASIHKGEEPPVSASGGSGTIFVSGCNLGCVFCQNYQISLGLTSLSNPKIMQPPVALGRIVDTAEFAQICLVLQGKGALNINIVTGSHAVPALVEGISAAKIQGLTIPVLWNSSAYELPETLNLLADTVNVFLPDMKTLDNSLAGQYFNAPDYPLIAAAAIKKMLNMKPLCVEKRTGKEKLVSGVMIRHLVLPGHLPASRKVLRWFADHCAGQALLSLMFQYTPLDLTWNPKEVAPNRYITRSEYETVFGWLAEFGIEDGYCQELVPGNTDWLPDFERPNPFPSDLSVPVWHWSTGFIP